MLARGPQLTGDAISDVLWGLDKGPNQMNMKFWSYIYFFAFPLDFGIKFVHVMPTCMLALKIRRPVLLSSCSFGSQEYSTC
jgi:hypothetical protein